MSFYFGEQMFRLHFPIGSRDRDGSQRQSPQIPLLVWYLVIDLVSRLLSYTTVSSFYLHPSQSYKHWQPVRRQRFSEEISTAEKHSFMAWEQSAWLPIEEMIFSCFSFK